MPEWRKVHPGCRPCAPPDAPISDTPPHSRGTMRPSFARQCRPMKSEGAGNAGCPMHPQPRVRFVVLVCTRVFTAEAPETSGIPHAMVLRLISRSPRGPGSLAPVVSQGLTPQTLAPASGRQDHTTLPSASSAFVLCAISVHRNPLHVRDDRETPLWRNGM